MSTMPAAPARLLDGNLLARRLQAGLAHRVQRFREQRGTAPVLAAVLVGGDPASEVYVRNKRRACERTGMDSLLLELPATVPTRELIDRIAGLNADSRVSGILVQLPLPRGIDATAVLDAIDPDKDVDGFHPVNTGRLLQGRPRFIPCTPAGILQLLAAGECPVAGRHVCILGRSDIVGKPLAALLVQRDGPLGPEYANATVTVCHSQTADPAQYTRQADVLVVAAGQPGLVTAGMVRPGAAVIDVGINRTPTGLVGDVDFPAVSRIAGAITPVPGGVGPLTVTMLLDNTLRAACLQHGLLPENLI